MTPNNLLQGKPLKMPLHTVIVHFPIALFTISTLLDIASYVVGGNPFVRGAFYTLAVGIITAMCAAFPGLVDYTTIRSDHPARKIATWHLVLNMAAVILYVLSFALRWNHRGFLHAPAVPCAISLLAITLIFVSGYLGGILVYDNGIGVGRHRRATPLPQRTLKPVAAPDALGFIPIIVATEIVEGQTLRVDVDGTIMTVGRHQGQIFAIQEFCTHRFGPLSEGCFKNGEVQCPWHNSRFDLRTGKVVHGPAKLEIKVFEVQIRDNQILVRTKPAAAPLRASAIGQKGEVPRIEEKAAPDQIPIAPAQRARQQQ
jgi:nitrite reductase/ring-hydroxylating ferredoxin subunit/uncharacterized membrane protein